MRGLFIALALALMPLPALATSTVYTGSLVVPTTGNITQSSGGTGCVLATGGIYAIGNCPAGTAAFSAGTNISITGTNPYTIACPNCFQATGGTVSGATTFSNTVTLNGAATTSTDFTISGNHSLLVNSALQFGSPGVGTTVQGVACSLAGIANRGVGWQACVDLNGNFGVNTVTATQYNISSKRAWKQDIQPLSLDALEVLRDVCWSSYRYRAGHGDPTQTHIGFVADCAPSIVSGPKHDHYDIEAVSTVDALAILQLQAQIKALYACVLTLVIIAFAIGVVALAKRA